MRHLLFSAVLLVVLTGIQSDVAHAEGSSRVTLDNAGEPLVATSGSLDSPPMMDDGGSAVVFESLAPAVEGDANNLTDIFVRLLEPGTNELLSGTPAGGAGNGASTGASMTADGQRVAFQSLASDLGDGDTNGVSDIFLRDRDSATTVRLSNAEDGSSPNGASFSASMDNSGGVVAFCSLASNLVSGDDNGTPDLYVIRLDDSATSRIEPPTPESGCARTAVSGDGTVIAASYTQGEGPGEVAQVYRYEAAGKESGLVSSADESPANGGSGLRGLSMNDDGSLVAFDSTATDLVDGDTNEASDVFLWSAETGEVTRASQLPDGQEGNSDSGTMGLNISGDGNWIVFSSLANNLLPGDANLSADVFRLDRSTGAITLVSADVFDRSANGPSYSPFVSDDGNTVAFTSLAGNVVINDRNRNPDVFLRTDNFPEVAGTGEVPSASPGDPALGLPPPTGDDGGVPGWALVAAIVAGVIAALAAGSYLLGRKPAA